MISIITVTYNNFDDLYRTLNSLNKVKGIEKVVVNGGDCHKTKKYLSAFDGIAISEPDKGISDAFNKGVSHANTILHEVFHAIIYQWHIELDEKVEKRKAICRASSKKYYDKKYK